MKSNSSNLLYPKNNPVVMGLKYQLIGMVTTIFMGPERCCKDNLPVFKCTHKCKKNAI